MTTIHIFTEEPSAKKVLDAILPKILPDNIEFRVYPHQGKGDLEKAFNNSIPTICKIPGSKVLITCDQDSSDCIKVKQNIEEKIELKCNCDYKIRIVCKELESWFLGDLNAIREAYPRFKPEQYLRKADFRNVDSINTPNKYLLKIIPELNNRSFLPKQEVAATISPHLDIDNNRSISFNHTLKAVKSFFDEDN